MSMPESAASTSFLELVSVTAVCQDEVPADNAGKLIEAHRGGLRLVLHGYCYVRNRSTSKKQ